MIAYQVSKQNVLPFRFGDQAHFMQQMDRWQCARVMYHVSEVANCIIYLPQAPMPFVCVVVLRRIKTISNSYLQQIFTWACSHHSTLAYEPIRLPKAGTASTINGSTSTLVPTPIQRACYLISSTLG